MFVYHVSAAQEVTYNNLYDEGAPKFGPSLKAKRNMERPFRMHEVK